jgi:hypothetical protein
LRPKAGRLLFGQLVKRKMYFFQFFLLDEWVIYFTSFPWTLNTSNSDSIWARGKFLLKMGIKLIFHVFFEELLHAALWLKLPKGWRAGFSKNSLFCPLNLGFSLFFTFFFLSWFYMTSPSMWPLRSECEVFEFFQEFLQGPQCWSLESRPLSTKIILAHSYLQIWSCNFSNVCSTWFGSEVLKTQKKDKTILFSLILE